MISSNRKSTRQPTTVTKTAQISPFWSLLQMWYLQQFVRPGFSRRTQLTEEEDTLSDGVYCYQSIVHRVLSSAVGEIFVNLILPLKFLFCFLFHSSKNKKFIHLSWSVSDDLCTQPWKHVIRQWIDEPFTSRSECPARPQRGLLEIVCKLLLYQIVLIFWACRAPCIRSECGVTF